MCGVAAAEGAGGPEGPARVLIVGRPGRRAFTDPGGLCRAIEVRWTCSTRLWRCYDSRPAKPRPGGLGRAIEVRWSC